MIALEVEMPQILVRNIETPLKARLQRQAKRNGRSMEAEAREILRNALCKEAAPKRGLGSEMVALFSGRGIGLKPGEEILEIRGMRMQIPKFEP
jgi:plasmid stability protein